MGNTASLPVRKLTSLNVKVPETGYIMWNDTRNKMTMAYIFVAQNDIVHQSKLVRDKLDRHKDTVVWVMPLSSGRKSQVWSGPGSFPIDTTAWRTLVDDFTRAIQAGICTLVLDPKGKRQRALADILHRMTREVVREVRG